MELVRVKGSTKRQKAIIIITRDEFKTVVAALPEQRFRKTEANPWHHEGTDEDPGPTKSRSIRQMANDPVPVASSTLLTVTELVNHYTERELSESNGKSAKVRKAYRYIFTNYVLPKWGIHPLAAVKAVEVEDWLKSLTKANGTKAKIREIFGAAFRHGMRHELFSANPIANVRQARKRTIEPSILEPSKIASILRELESVEPVRTAFLTAALTGIRRGELFGLKWEDMDFGRAILHIRRSFVDGVEGPPKTESSRRPCQYRLKLSRLSKRGMVGHPSHAQVIGCLPPSRRLVSNHSGPGTPWRRNVAPAIKRAEITKPKLGWHSLRRSYASLPLATGASLRVSMELMRHSTGLDDAGHIRSVNWRR
jgi:integrase